jgi:hypothetical protein
MEVTALQHKMNGINGQPFYCCVYEHKEGQYLATFTSDDTDKIINPKSCRVVCLTDLGRRINGSYVAEELQEELNIQAQVNGVGTIYDLSNVITYS